MGVDEGVLGSTRRVRSHVDHVRIGLCYHKVSRILSFKCSSYPNVCSRMSLEAVPVQVSTLVGSSSPIQSIPNELLTAIFKFGVELPSSFIGELPFLLLVSSVNRHWRTVAINSPDLWSNIYVSHKMVPIALTQLWLERSKSCLVDITFDVSDHMFPLASPSSFRSKRRWIPQNFISITPPGISNSRSSSYHLP